MSSPPGDPGAGISSGSQRTPLGRQRGCRNGAGIRRVHGLSDYLAVMPSSEFSPVVGVPLLVGGLLVAAYMLYKRLKK